MRVSLWVVGILFVYSLMTGEYSIPNIVRLKLEKESLIRANRELAVELVDATWERELLLHDPIYIEKIARARYHLARPNETIYRYRGQ